MYHEIMFGSYMLREKLYLIEILEANLGRDILPYIILFVPSLILNLVHINLTGLYLIINNFKSQNEIEVYTWYYEANISDILILPAMSQYNTW